MDLHHLDVDFNDVAELLMTCKHNWIPSLFAIKYRTPNHYMFQCTKCHKTIDAILKDQS